MSDAGASATNSFTFAAPSFSRSSDTISLSAGRGPGRAIFHFWPSGSTAIVSPPVAISRPATSARENASTVLSRSSATGRVASRSTLSPTTKTAGLSRSFA